MIKFSESIKTNISNLREKLSKFLNNFYAKHPIIILLLFIVIIWTSIKYNNLHSASIYFGLLILLSSFYIFFRKELKKDDFSELDNFERILRSAGVLSIIFLSITYILINFAKYMIPDVLHFGSVDSWIQFSGSILGGTLTLVALAYTLNEQEKNREEDKKNQLLPIVEFNILNNVEESKKNENDFEVFKIWYLKIENVSDNPLRNIKVIRHKVFLFNSEDDLKELNLQLLNVNSLLPNIIAKNKIHYSELDLNFYEIADIESKFYQYLYIEIYFEYYDVLLKNIHHHNFDIMFRNNRKDRRSIDNGNFIWTLEKLNNTFID